MSLNTIILLCDLSFYDNIFSSFPFSQLQTMKLITASSENSERAKTIAIGFEHELLFYLMHLKLTISFSQII